VAENNDMDANTIFRKIYDSASVFMKKESIPEAVLILGNYQYKHSFCADSEINLACCLTELMVNVEWV
jgi:replication factor C small subunit